MKIGHHALLVSAALCIGCSTRAYAIDTVDSLDVEKYLGRWYQLYGNAFTAMTITRDGTCIAADYGLDEPTGNITVINSQRKFIPTGELNTITGYAYGTDEAEPGQLKVHLGNVPVDGDYWIAALGPKSFGSDELYEWAIVTGPEALTLFVLVRDVPRFEELFAPDVLQLIEDLGFTGPLKAPVRIVQEGCLPFDPDDLEDTQSSSSADGSGIFDPVVTVTELDVDRYVGRWYQAYASRTVYSLLEQNGACVTADYATQDDGTISVLNTARAQGVNGELVEIEGFAYYKDPEKPGQLTVSLQGTPFDAPYWVLGLGDDDEDEEYSWSIVSDPVRAFLFVLVRDIDAFPGSQLETELLELCEQLGFTNFWNKPVETVHDGCTYTTPPSVTATAVGSPGGYRAVASPRLASRNEASVEGSLGPIHASCKVTWTFPSDGCKAVSDALVAAAEGMGGFEQCDGGNKCGYSVTTVTETSADFVHETSVKHYLDDMTVTFEDEGTSCSAKGFSTSETWYAVLDNGVNYCNLHNLVEATGLAYEETDVSDNTCTQYSTADCERY